MRKIDHIFPAKYEAKDSDLLQNRDPAKRQSGTISKNFGKDELEHLKGDYNRWLPIAWKR